MPMRVLIPSLLLACAAAQQPAPPQGEAAPPPAAAASQPPGADELIAGFAALDADRQSRVLAAIERRLQLHPDPTIQRIVSLQRGLAAYPAMSPEQYFPPQQYAPPAPARTLVARGAPRHRPVAASFPPPPFLDDLVCGVVFDWTTGKAARLPQQPDTAQRFANLAHGYLPGSDQAVAQVLEALAGPPSPRTRFFEHLYADRDGHVFAGVRLYDAWYSGRLVEVPDVEAIAFARELLHTQAFVSPISADRRRERLYQKIQDAALQERKYRTLRQAAAATFVAAAPPIDPAYASLVDRFHYLWPTVGHDLQAMAKLIAESGDRDQLLESVDQRLAADPDGWRLRTQDRQQLADVDVFLREVCAWELRQVQKQAPTGR